MKYYINEANVREGANYKALAKFEADNVRGVEIEATDEIDAIKQFNQHVEKAQPKWRATAAGIDWTMRLLIVLVGEYDNGSKQLVRWVVKK